MENALTDGRVPVELNGKTYYALMDLNAIAEIQERFGSLQALAKMNGENIKDLIWIFTLVFNEGRDEGEPEYTERQIGRLIHTGNMDACATILSGLFQKSIAGNNKPSSAEGN